MYKITLFNKTPVHPKLCFEGKHRYQAEYTKVYF